jgi:hypothetical protein
VECVVSFLVRSEFGIAIFNLKHKNQIKISAVLDSTGNFLILTDPQA